MDPGQMDRPMDPESYWTNDEPRDDTYTTASLAAPFEPADRRRKLKELLLALK